jgi:hypothetical protein
MTTTNLMSRIQRTLQLYPTAPDRRFVVRHERYLDCVTIELIADDWNGSGVQRVFSKRLSHLQLHRAIDPMKLVAAAVIELEAHLDADVRDRFTATRDAVKAAQPAVALAEPGPRRIRFDPRTE